MIIPIRCFTCGKVLADKWNYFNKKSKELEKSSEDTVLTIEDLKIDEDTKTDNYFASNKKGEILNELGLTKLCCRRHMLGHVDLIEVI